MEKDKSVPRP